jgi:hypothetical protein
MLWSWTGKGREAGPLEEYDKHAFIHCLIQDLNKIFALDLNEDPIIDRFPEEEVFNDHVSALKPLLLLADT